MKIKRFENISEGPKVGDYVICEEGNLNFKDFIESNIGVIYKEDTFRNNKYYVKYKNIPINVKKGFIRIDNANVRVMYLDEILHFSSNKEELESILVSKKYNL